MATKTQKNFKKQMKEIEKELNKNKKRNRPFYSYIERNHINTYYDKKFKRIRMVSGVTLGIIILIIFRIAGFTLSINEYIKPSYNNSPALTMHPVSISSSNLNIENPQIEIVGYLNRVNPFKKEIINMLNYRHENLQVAINNNINSKSFYENISQSIKRTDVIKISLNKINPPKELQVYNEMYKECVNNVSTILIKTLELKNINISNEKNKIINECNQLIIKNNKNSQIIHNELIQVFEAMDINYIHTKDGLRYWYKEN